MSFYRYNRGWFGALPEEVFGYGTDDGEGTPAVDPASLVFTKFRSVEMPAGFEYVDGSDVRQGDEEDRGQFLRAIGEGSLEMGLTPTSLSAQPDAAPVDPEVSGYDDTGVPPIAMWMKASLGACITAGAAQAITAATSATGVVEVAATAAFGAGEGIAIMRGVNVVWFGRAKAIAEDTSVTIYPAPGDYYTYAEGDVLVGGYTYPMVSESEKTSMAVCYKGEPTDYVHTGMGVAVGDMTITAPYRGQAKVDFKLHFAKPEPPDTDASHAGLESVAYSWPDASQVVNGGLFLRTREGTLIKHSGGFEIAKTAALSDVGGIHAVDPNGVQQWVETDRRVRITIKPAYIDASAWNYVKADTGDGLVLTGWFGVGPRVWGFQAPAAFMTSTPDKSDDNGKLMQDIVLACGAYSGDTGTFAATDAGNKPFMVWQLAGTIA